jgi:ATP synthase in type III secretion protein N
VIACGTVRTVRNGWIHAEMPPVALGTAVRIGTVAGRVRAIDDGRAWIALHGSSIGISEGATVVEDVSGDRTPLGTCALGRAIDANGTAIDGGPAIGGRAVSIDSDPTLARAPIATPLWTGVKAIDALLTIGRGARIGLFGSPGAGKSTLLETIADGAEADAVVIGLVGERGREAQAWMRARRPYTTMVCATSDRPAAERVRAASVAMAQAGSLAARGLHVLVLLDSLARTASAMRELALAIGEPVGRGGYPASVFADLARLVERAGSFECGSVTLVATVLSDGDDRDPVSDAARSLLDGHVQLSQALAAAGRFPAIDVAASASRTMGAVAGPEHLDQAATLRGALALLERTHDARTLGIEIADRATLAALEAEPSIEQLLRQGATPVSAMQTLAVLAETADMLGEADGHHD